MKRLLCLITTSVIYAQLWSGIITAPRAVDWSTAGATIDVRTKCGSTISAYTGTAGTINSAISACGSNQYVELGAGTFTLSTGIELDKNNVTLRGQGASSTILDINGNTAVSCHIGDGRVVNMCSNGANIGVDSPDNTATWSAGYSQGTTVITLSANTNLTVGSTIWLDQLDDSDGYPAAGDTWVDNWGAGDAYARADRGLVEGHTVTACGTSTPGAACTSNTVTISPGIWMPTFRSGQSPGAWWGSASSMLYGAGLENLTIDSTGSNAIFMINCTNCWVKGVRVIYQGVISSGQYRVTDLINCAQCSIIDSYFYGPQASGLVSIYGVAVHVTSALLFQNNIVHGSVNPVVINSPTYGSVFAYNNFNNVSVDPDFSQPSFILHGHANMNLFEGNNMRNFSSDNIHSTHNFGTLFRNVLEGTTLNPSNTEAQSGFTLYAASRFFNLVGNVMGGSAVDWSSYRNTQSPPAHCSTCVYEFGWQGTNSGGIAATGNDTNVNRTVLRWGNWDNVTNATRWCGNSSNTGWSTTCSSTTEVPSGITNYPNSIPSTETLPNSFYLSALPSSWWGTPYGTPSWPAIGPDVSGGSISTVGGHANKIPSRLCFENASDDGAYPSSSPRIKSFSAATCYGAASSTTRGAAGTFRISGNGSLK